MRLRLTAPTRVLVDRDVTYVQAEDLSGRFGILPRHEPYLTALVPSILIYRYDEGGRRRESYVAVRNGVLRVTAEGVQVADPLFVDPEHDDYRLRPESPAFKLGFQPIPVEQIGMRANRYQ